MREKSDVSAETSPARVAGGSDLPPEDWSMSKVGEDMELAPRIRSVLDTACHFG
jgi:hypothetical protein